jgi:hypothetical protein
VYTIVPPAKRNTLDRFIPRPEQLGAEDQTGAWLRSVTLPAAALLEFHCCPSALWSVDRSDCLFNGAMIALLGFHDRDFRGDRELWLARIERGDRQSFISSWKTLQSGVAKMVCRYRFTPRSGASAIDVEETAWLIPGGAAGRPAVLSRYQTNGAPRAADSADSPLDRLAHQIGNNLQAIRGEVDLLRLFNGLPQRSFDTIVRGIDNIQSLIAGIDGAAVAEPAPFTSPESGHGADNNDP